MEKSVYDDIYNIESINWWYKARRDIICRFVESMLDKFSNNLILDVGCGCGSMLNILKKYGQVTGMDYSDEALNYSSSLFDGELFQIDLGRTVIPDLCGKYDIVLCLDVLEHVRNDKRAISNLKKMLDQKGHLIVTVPAYQWLWTKHDDIAMHFRRYRKNDLKKKLQKAGFRVQFISYFNFFLFLPAAIIKLISKINKSSFSYDVGNSFHDSAINTVLYQIFRLEELFRTRGISFPFGVSIIAICEKY